MSPAEKIIVALDTPTSKKAFEILSTLTGLVKNVKIGPGLFIQEGPPFIKTLQLQGYRVFLDLKLHDIPNTVASGVKAAQQMGIWMMSVHLSGGRKMLEAAVTEAKNNPLLVGITILTSLDATQFEEIGFLTSLPNQVKRLAELALKTKLDGVVASPQEIELLRSTVGKDMLLITPGIRLPGSPPDDQARTMTPQEAVEKGADYVVIGRPIVEARNPKEALASILASLQKARKR